MVEALQEAGELGSDLPGAQDLLNSGAARPFERAAATPKGLGPGGAAVFCKTSPPAEPAALAQQSSGPPIPRAPGVHKARKRSTQEAKAPAASLHACSPSLLAACRLLKSVRSLRICWHPRLELVKLPQLPMFEPLPKATDLKLSRGPPMHQAHSGHKRFPPGSCDAGPCQSAAANDPGACAAWPHRQLTTYSDSPLWHSWVFGAGPAKTAVKLVATRC